MKNKKQAYTITLFIAAAFILFGCRKEKIKPEQADTFIKYYGKGGTQTAGNVALTADGGYILAGTSDSYGNGKDILVVKTDKYGNEIWSKVLGGAGDDAGNCVIAAANGNYILTGSKSEAGGSNTDIYVTELTDAGIVVSENTYGTAGKDESGSRIINTLDKGYAVIGNTTDYTGAAQGIYILKINSASVKEWEAKFGNNSSSVSANAVNTGTAIQQLNDSTYVTTANTVDGTNLDVLVTKGRLQKNPFFYNASSSINKSVLKSTDPSTSVVQVNDLILESGNKCILGENSNGNIYIAKVGLDNEAINVFTVLRKSAQDIAASFSRTSDGGFIVAGSTMENGNWDILVIRTDANGNMIWSKTYGGTGSDYGASAIQKADGTIVVSGTIAFGGNATGANQVMSLLHIDANGELK